MDDRYQVVPRRLATQDLRDAAAHYAAEVDAATAHRFIDAAEQVITLINRRPRYRFLRSVRPQQLQANRSPQTTLTEHVSGVEQACGQLGHRSTTSPPGPSRSR